MIRIVIKVDETGRGMNIESHADDGVTFAVVTSAYHELLTRKIRGEIMTELRAHERRIVTP